MNRSYNTQDTLRAERARAIRLFAWLDDIGRYGGGPSMLRPAWTRLAELLEYLAETEQKRFPGQPQQRSRPAGGRGPGRCGVVRTTGSGRRRRAFVSFQAPVCSVLSSKKKGAIVAFSG